MKLFTGIVFAFLFTSGLLFAQQPKVDFLGNINYGYHISDIWGYAANGSEYALVGLYDGTSIVDVTDPCNPVQLEFFQGDNSIWRDLKTWGNYAYEINETGGGLRIFDLSDIDNNITYTDWTNAQFFTFTNAHNIFIDENGIGYIVGGGVPGGGCMLIDIASNPTNPQVLHVYDDQYVHDVFARGDTMWLSEFYQSRVTIFDVSDKTDPQLIGLFNTPSGATHNAWVSDDNKHVFTTDETGGGKVASFNVSDMNNIYLQDIYESNPGSGSIPHNVHVLGDYLVTSYYNDGVTVADISDPANVVEVAAYDTDPLASGPGFDGCWGAYPYLPSGNILATDQDNGLFILGDAASACSQRLEVDFKVFLEGPMDGNSMLANLGSLIPLQQPYNTSPYNYAGSESLSSIPSNMVDWILVEVRDNATPNLTGSRATTTLATRAAILLDNGKIVDLDGVSPLIFENLDPNTGHYFCIRHRNHLDILTANPLSASGQITYDFTDSDAKVFGPLQLKLINFGTYAMFVGDFNYDGSIQNTDRDSWKSAPAILNTYNYNDGNMDGSVQVTDYDRWYSNRTKAGVAEIDY